MNTQYITQGADAQYERSRRGLCINCAAEHGDDCPTRLCEVCDRVWLSDVPKGGDESGPYRENCSECRIEFPERHPILRSLSEVEIVRAETETQRVLVAVIDRRVA